MKQHRDLELERSIGSYFKSFLSLVRQIDVAAVARVVNRLDAARRRGSTIYVAGNGGSAATASHWVNDLGKATKNSDHEPMRVMSLSDNVSWVTALANDEGYERVFSGQLENFARSGDVLIVISASGNSPNLLRAVELAQRRELETIALVGFDGGALKGMVDDHIWLPTPKGAYGLVESAHGMLCHAVTLCLAELPRVEQLTGTDNLPAESL